MERPDSPKELSTEADDVAPLTSRESDAMGSQTERARPGHALEDQTVYGDVDDSVENEGQADMHNASWKDLP